MDYCRIADNTPTAAYASRNHVSGQRRHLSDYATTQELAAAGTLCASGRAKSIVRVYI